MTITITLAEEVPAQEDRGWGPTDPVYDSPAAGVRRLMEATGWSAEHAVMELLDIALTFGPAYLPGDAAQALRPLWQVQPERTIG